MQRTLAYLLLSVLFSGASLTYAQDTHDIATTTDGGATSTTETTVGAEATTSPEATTSEEAAPTIIEDTGAFNAELEAHRTAFQTKIQERVYNLMQNIAGRMRAASDRLTNIADRIDTRATILAQHGKDTGAARPYLESARQSLADAQALMHEDLGIFAYSEDPRGAFPAARDRVYAIGQHIRDARESLRGALQVLKDADSAATSVTASSTEDLEVQ